MDAELIAQIEQIVQLVFAVIGGAATVAAATPTKRDDRIIGKLMQIIDVVGLNVFNARNAK